MPAENERKRIEDIEYDYRGKSEFIAPKMGYKHIFSNFKIKSKNLIFFRKIFKCQVYPRPQRPNHYHKSKSKR